MQRIAIFGATSAIAGACARLLVRQGRHLFLVGRNKEKLEALAEDLRCLAAGSGSKVLTAQADLDNCEGHEPLFDSAEQGLGGLDAILIAHGSLSDQRACEQSAALMIREVHLNALSVASLLTIAANRFEAAQRGVIAAISSVAGDRGRKSNYVYGAAKGFISLFMQGLRNRLHRKGVRVVTIKPGFVITPMTAHMERKGALWATPERVAKSIVRAMERADGEVYCPSFWRAIMWVIRHIPERIFKRMSL